MIVILLQTVEQKSSQHPNENAKAKKIPGKQFCELPEKVQ